MCGFLVFQGPKKDFPQFETALEKLKARGPDETRIFSEPSISMGFHRLAIMGLTPAGGQPFHTQNWSVVCNGEIYNFQEIKKQTSSFAYQSESDCEVLLPLLETKSIAEIASTLDGEYAFVAWQRSTKKIVAARDPMGIRPLFWGVDQQGRYGFASEAKALSQHFKEITPFPPGHYFDGEKLVSFCDLASVKDQSASLKDYYHNGAPTQKMAELLKPVRELLSAAVIKRLHSDAPLGALLSGGLDSSLVCSIAMKHLKREGRAPLKTFAIGMDRDPIDLRYAREVADAIGSDHTEIIMTQKDILSILRKVIWHLETWDITTIRASIGMYFICQKIRETTDLKVLLTGEVSDELFGYKYTDFAPSNDEFQAEAAKRVKELYLYDVLRADRCLSGNSLEARVPFSDTEFVKAVMALPAELKRNHYGHGKYLLREAFREGDYLPTALLMREKAAFSDAVGHSLVDTLKAYAAEVNSEDDLKNAKKLYPHGTPFTLESLLYRQIFEEFYPGRSAWIPDFWMPNKTWQNCNVNDPSARVLPNYGLSGQ